MDKVSYYECKNVSKRYGNLTALDKVDFHIGKNEEPLPGQTEKEALGSMILFPSYLVHRVLPMTKGTRYAIVGWVHGNSFR